VVFLLLEASARVYLFGLAGLSPSKVNSTRWRESIGIRYSTEPGIGYEMEPNLDMERKLVRFRTNSRGLRDREYPLEKPEDTFRVAVLGASFALPTGVEIENAFHSLLEDRLSAEFAPTRYEFINFAVGASHPRQMLAMLKWRALEYDPDLILVSLTRLSFGGLMASDSPTSGRHVMQPVDRRRTYPFFRSFLVLLVRQRTGTMKPGVPSPGILERGIMWIAEGWAEPGGQRVEKPTQPIRPMPWGRDDRSVIERLGEMSTETGIPIVLALLYLNASHELPAAGRVVEEARARGLYFVNTAPAFEGRRPQDLWIYPMDPHPNREAHEIFARVIGRFLRENDLLGR
jgi:hypothetical protein